MTLSSEQITLFTIRKNEKLIILGTWTFLNLQELFWIYVLLLKNYKVYKAC